MDLDHLEHQFWRLIDLRYPVTALWWHGPEAVPSASWPDWTPDAFHREELAWLECAEAALETEGPEAARWAHHARQAAVRLKAGLYRRPEAPLWTVLSATAVWGRLGPSRRQGPVRQGLAALPRFLETAACTVTGSRRARPRVQSLAGRVRTRLKGLADEVGLTGRDRQLTLEPALYAVDRYLGRVPFQDSSPAGVLPWLPNAPPGDIFAARRQELQEAVPAPAALPARAGWWASERLGLRLGAVTAPVWAPAALEDSDGLAILGVAVQQVWLEQCRRLDGALADPAALPAVLDWLARELAQMPGPWQAGWRWTTACREAMVLADAWLWLEGEDPGVVTAWLEPFLGEASHTWVSWLFAEPGWALMRCAWRDLRGLGDLRPEAPVEAVLALAPSASPAYWQWRPDPESARLLR